MKLVPPSLPWSSYVSVSFRSVLQCLFNCTNRKLSTNSHIVTTSLIESSKLFVYDLFLSVEYYTVNKCHYSICEKYEILFLH
jgi:hypothetical protein